MTLHRTTTLITMGFSVLLMLGVATTRAKADEWNHKTIVTFSAPVEIPGPGSHGVAVLPAGTYVFTLLDSQTDRNIVQIFNKDQNHLYATILAIPDYRLKPAGKTIVKFEERPSGSPEAIKAWFYPGVQWGQEFVYPKHRAVELAKASNEPVLSMPEETSENIDKPIKSANESSVQAMEHAPVKAENPSGSESEMSAVVTPPPAKSSN
jgi:hypothetical protein